MRINDWTVLRQNVAVVGQRLETGRHSTADDWEQIAAQLREAAELAETEAKERAEAETAGRRERWRPGTHNDRD